MVNHSEPVETIWEILGPWICLWGIILIKVIGVGRPTLNVGGITWGRRSWMNEVESVSC